jgi:hypothetical protein
MVALAAMWLQPVSPLHNAYNQIRVGMNAVQVEEVLERCGWGKYRKPASPGLITGGRDVAKPYFSLFALSGTEILMLGVRMDTLTYQGADGETLTIFWAGKWSDWEHGQPLDGHVAGKEYHSGIGLKLRDWWNRLRRTLHW